MAAIDFSRVPGSVSVDLCALARQKSAEAKRKESK